jgi:tetratricopeptide (TPR) repeat protein
MRLPHNGAMRRRLAMLVFGVALASSSPALADGAEAGKAFDEGRKLRDQKDFDKAASAFERSVAAEPSIGAYYNLAFSYEQLGRTRDALDAYRKALKLAKEKGDPREKESNDAIAKLLETHNYVTVLVSDEADKTAGVRIVVDGEVVPQKQLKGEVFRSGTQHEVVISAPGRKDRRVAVANRQHVTVTLGEVHDGASSPPPPPPPPVESHGEGWGWQKWTGVGLGVAGVGALVVGAVFTADYFSTRSDILERFNKLCKSGCPSCGSTTPTPTTMALGKLNEEAQANEDRAPLRQAIAYGVGGLLLVGGVYLFVTAPSGSTEASPPASGLRVRVVPQVGVRDNGLSVVGTF